MQDKTPAVLTHSLGILLGATAVFGWVGPLVCYFAFKDKATPWLRDHLDEALNFRILVAVALTLLVVLAVFLGGAGIWPALLAVIIYAVSLLLGLVAILKAVQGKPYHYPLDVKIVK